MKNLKLFRLYMFFVYHVLFLTITNFVQKKLIKNRLEKNCWSKKKKK